MTYGALAAIQNETMTLLSELLVPGQRVALVDFPNHENSGDSLIFLGQLNYLRQLGVRVDYIADGSRYNPIHLRSLVPEGPILIQGGGNFGDRWEYMQALREKVIADFPDRRIIQLPQGIDFREGERLERAQDMMGSHPSLTLLIRDHAGVARTKELFPTATVIFCPDMAFGYGLVKHRYRADLDAVILRRNDTESLAAGRSFAVSSDVSHVDVDWGLRGYYKVVARVLRIPGAITKRVPQLAVAIHPLQKLAYRGLALVNVRHAVKMLARGRLIVTDRLHATVLAALMGKPVIALDNANGKVSAIVNDYLGTMPNVQFSEGKENAELLMKASLSGT